MIVSQPHIFLAKPKLGHTIPPLLFTVLILYIRMQSTVRCTMALTTASQHHIPLPNGHVHCLSKYQDTNASINVVMSSFHQGLVSDIGKIAKHQKRTQELILSCSIKSGSNTQQPTREVRQETTYSYLSRPTAQDEHTITNRGDKGEITYSYVLCPI